MIPSTIPSTAGGSTAIAPGAETVGQAQILTEFSDPFELAGLFGAADESAFASEEVTMGEDTAHESEMVANDTLLRLPLKRSHSPGPVFGSKPDPESWPGVAQRPTSDAWSVRIPKRFRRAQDLSAYEEAAASAKH